MRNEFLHSFAYPVGFGLLVLGFLYLLLKASAL